MEATPDIKAIRTSLGWTQGRMAEYLGLDRSTVSRLENGAEISGPVLRLLALLSEPQEPRPLRADERLEA